MNIRVSVVVPTYNRADLLHNCLEALLQQDYPPDAYEVIVADNAGSAETWSLVQSLAATSRARKDFPVIRYISAAKKPGPAAARNEGWRAAQGEYIAFTDDDCRPEPCWIAEGAKALDRGLDAARGRVSVPIADTPTDYEKNVSRLGTDMGFVTANCFFRCDALHRIGGFDEAYTSAWREDSDIYFNLLEHGCLLGWAPRATVVHPVRRATWGISLREQRKSMFNALLFKKYPRQYRQRIQARPPLRYYAIVASAAACIAGLLMAKAGLVLVTSTLWSALTVDFALERLRGTRHSMEHVTEMFVTSLLIPFLSVFWRLYGAMKFRVWFL